MLFAIWCSLFHLAAGSLIEVMIVIQFKKKKNWLIQLTYERYSPVLNYSFCVNEISTHRNIDAMKTKTTPFDSSWWAQTDSWFKMSILNQEFSWVATPQNMRGNFTTLQPCTYHRIHTKHFFVCFFVTILLLFNVMSSFCKHQIYYNYI